MIENIIFKLPKKFDCVHRIVFDYTRISAKSWNQEYKMKLWCLPWSPFVLEGYNQTIYVYHLYWFPFPKWLSNMIKLVTLVQREEGLRCCRSLGFQKIGPWQPIYLYLILLTTATFNDILSQEPLEAHCQLRWPLSGRGSLPTPPPVLLRVGANHGWTHQNWYGHTQSWLFG